MRYKTKKVKVDAIQWSGKNYKKIFNFVPSNVDVGGFAIPLSTLETLKLEVLDECELELDPTDWLIMKDDILCACDNDTFELIFKRR
jgi:hypothetical protein